MLSRASEPITVVIWNNLGRYVHTEQSLREIFSRAGCFETIHEKYDIHQISDGRGDPFDEQLELESHWKRHPLALCPKSFEKLQFVNHLCQR